MKTERQRINPQVPPSAKVALFFEEFIRTPRLSRGVGQNSPDAGGGSRSYPLRPRHGSWQLRPRCRYPLLAVLRIAHTLLKRFSTNFYGKISPVHFFWGSFDLTADVVGGTSVSRSKRTGNRRCRTAQVRETL